MLKVTTSVNPLTRESGYTTASETRSLPSSAPKPASEMIEKNVDSAQMREKIARQVEELNRFVKARQAQIEFEIDDSNARVITKIVDVNTREVLRQIPNEEVLRIAEALSDSLASTSGESLKLVQAKA